MILIDAGPMVALVNARDRHHEACAEAFAALDRAPLTVWPAFTEAMYLLGFSDSAQEALWQFLLRGAIRLGALGEEDAPRMRALMRTYRDRPMDLADAALVRVAEREGISTILTIDRADFSIYRPAGVGSFTILP